MPPISLNSNPPAQLRAASENPFAGRILLAQATSPRDGGTATDAGPPPVASDAGGRSDVTSPPPPPAAPTAPLRLSLAQITLAARERASLLNDSHLLGSQYEAFRANPSRYSVLRDALTMIQYFMEGRHPDLSSARPAILAWLREAHRTGDTVLVESVGNVLAALGELRADLNRGLSATLLTQIQEVQQLVSTHAATSVPAPTIPATPGTGSGSSTGSSTTATSTSAPLDHPRRHRRGGSHTDANHGSTSGGAAPADPSTAPSSGSGSGSGSGSSSTAPAAPPPPPPPPPPADPQPPPH